MRTSHAEYTFSKSEIRILRELAKGRRSLSEIERLLSLKPALLSYNLNKLLRKRLIETAGQRNRKCVCFSDTRHASLLRDLLIYYDYIDWQNILTDKTIEILFQTLATSEGSMAKFPKATLWRHLKNLKARGIITQTERRYNINSRFSILIDFLKEYQRFFANKLAKTLSENAVILWQEDMEFIVRAPKKAKPPSADFHRTATSIFHEYNLQLLSEFDIYLYSTNRKTIRPEDAILHTLLIEPNNVRYTTYSLLLLKKNEQKIDNTYLLQEAERLGLKSRICNMLQFLKMHTQPKDHALPTWNEFITKARDYNVVIE
jgi:DNA-binding MarR family transcriptional regulator